MASLVGTEIDGRYRVIAKLDEGGMGEVYLAEHVHLDRQEALKFLHAELAGDPEFAARFRREARAMNRLSHPNIVSVYDFGRSTDGRFYLAIEYAAGPTLADVIAAEGALAVPRVTRVLLQLAEAVEHAHGRGVIHRDLTPRNLVLVSHRGADDVVKVLDFGLAKIVAPDDDGASTSRAGGLRGTVGYLAPELFAGEPASARSDLYAIGCIAWEMLVGRPPFVGRPAQVMEAHLRTPPAPPGAHRPGGAVPRALEQAVLRCLDKDPRYRPADAGELVEVLANVITDRVDARRSQRRIAASGLPPVPRLDDYAEDEATADHATQGGRAGEHPVDAGRAPTLLLPLAEAVSRYRAGIRQLGEALLDLGADDVRLGVGLAQLGRLELDLDREAAAMDDLEQQLDDAEQRAREREAMIRFAMGDLRFVRDQARARDVDVGAEVDDQLAALGGELTRLLAERDRAIAAITGRQLEVAARLAEIEEAILAHCFTLDPIAETASRGVDAASVEAARDQVLSARLLLQMAGGRR